MTNARGPFGTICKWVALSLAFILPRNMLPLAQPSRRSPDALLDSATLWAARISWTLASVLRWMRIGMRILWFELCSAAPRIAIALDTIRGLPQEIHDPGDLGPLFEPDSAPGGLVPCRRTDVRTQDVARLQTTYPWATEADQWMFLLGWERGEAFACRNQRKKETPSATSKPA